MAAAERNNAEAEAMDAESSGMNTDGGDMGGVPNPRAASGGGRRVQHRKFVNKNA